MTVTVTGHPANYPDWTYTAEVDANSNIVALTLTGGLGSITAKLLRDVPTGEILRAANHRRYLAEEITQSG